MKNYIQIQYENVSKTKEKREDRINPTKNLSIAEKENPIEYERQSKMNVNRKVIFANLLFADTYEKYHHMTHFNRKIFSILFVTINKNLETISIGEYKIHIELKIELFEIKN